MRHWVGSLVLPLLVACGGEPDSALTGRQTATVRAEVERTLRDVYDLSRPGLPERMLALYPETGSVVSAASGAVLTSRDTLEDGVRYFWDNVGSNMRDARWVWDRFFIDVLSPAAAAVTATYHIPHLNPRGEPHVLGGAMTVVMVKRGGRWIVLQEHLSDLPQTEPSIGH